MSRVNSIRAALKNWRKQIASGEKIACALCGNLITNITLKGHDMLTADHIVPQSLGGHNAQSNLQPAHRECNARRRTMLVSEFKEILATGELVRRAIAIIDKYHGYSKGTAMSTVDLVSYQPLVDALKVPLPDKIDQRERLRGMVAFAESYGIIVSEHRRRLLTELERQMAAALQRLRDGITLNEDNQLVQSDEEAAKFAKLNADEKKIVLASEVSGISAELEFVTNLENLIKRRCSLGQTISNSFNTETQSSYNN